MKYHVVFDEYAKRQLKKLDKYVQKMILLWLKKYIDGCVDPRLHGKALSGNRAGQWRYRVGDYRIIAIIHDNELVVLVVNVGHRREVYQLKST